MKNTTHRVVILKNCNSDLISQAIFFLKDTSEVPEPKILAEAEKIVEKYMKSESITLQKIPEKPRKKLLSFAVLGTFALGIACIIFALFR